jgi:adenine C2-methylase RlmN of 23S rRNA A2503 and tRNA A37
VCQTCGIGNEGKHRIQRYGELTDQVNDTARVAPLVVVPRDKLDKVVVEGDTGRSVENGRVAVTIQIRGDKSVLGVGENT